MIEKSPVRQRPVLIFLHIPKTGGTTLTEEILKHRFGDHDRYQFFGLFLSSVKKNKVHSFLALPQRERDRFDFLYGHVPMGVHRTLSRPCRYITLLRDLLPRLVSNYFQLIENEEGYMCELVKDGLTLEDFLVHEMVANGMTKWLGGFDAMSLMNTTTHEEFQDYWRRKEVTPAMLEKARANLRDHFMLAGTTERFSDFVFMLSRELGWRSPPRYSVRRVNPATRDAIEKLPPDVVSEFLKRNSHDVALYAYAKDLFERRWRRLGMGERLRAGVYGARQRWIRGRRRGDIKDGSSARKTGRQRDNFFSR